MKRLGIVTGVLLLLGLPAVQLARFRTDLCAQRRGIDAAWARVEAALERRADLVACLVGMAMAIAGREPAVADSLTNARAALAGARTPAEKIAANARLDRALARLLVALEEDPGFESGGDFARVLDELYGAESRLAEERRKYNETVQKYNLSVRLFPGNLAAALFGFAPSDAYFPAGPASAIAPNVAF